MTFAMANVGGRCDRAPPPDPGGEGPVATVAIPTAAPRPSYTPAWATAALTVPPPVPTTTSAPDPMPAWTLPQALAGLAGAGPLMAKLETTKGPIECKLYEDKAPLAVAHFVGLARALRPWKNASGEWVKTNAYDGTKFHRIWAGYMIQGGDFINGDGTGEPGFTFRDEVWPGMRHDRAGQLCAASAGANRNGAQFFITDGPAPHLDTGFTIFGECTPVARIHEIATGPVNGEKATDPVVIKKVTIGRGKL
jgi:peptidyl-prolyl cis-trans isomerase A (cyclophilin A)